MGRIDEALRRAAEHEDGGDHDGAGDPAVAAAERRVRVAVVVRGEPAAAAPAATGADQPRRRSSRGPTAGRAAWPCSAASTGPSRSAWSIGKGAPPLLAEQFRRLAATLHHAQLVQKLKVIMVTSAIAGEGKTLTATNLALTLSESYRRDVLLIDADLRRPSLHDVFERPERRPA